MRAAILRHSEVRCEIRIDNARSTPQRGTSGSWLSQAISR
jgi:hypothetical protein